VSGSGPLYDIAKAVFDRLDEAFAASASPPERRYVHVGALPEDFSEQLVVVVESVSFGLPSSPGQLSDFQVGASVTVNLAAIVLRDVPTIDEAGTPPIPEDMSAVSAALLADGWLMLSTVLDGYVAGALVPSCSDLTIGPMLAIGPEGGTAGFRIPISVGL
jgi:hypothetical protein